MGVSGNGRGAARILRGGVETEPLRKPDEELDEERGAAATGRGAGGELECAALC